MFGGVSSIDTPSIVTTSYSSVAVNGGAGSGIHGDIRSPNITVTNSYYNKDVARATEQHTAGRTLAELRSGTPTDDIFTDWSTDIWDFGTATELPIVTALDNLPPASHSDDTDHDGLIEISTVSELQALESRIGTECPSATCHGFELDDDIDLNGVTWDPIKAQSDEFNLIFDGNDHTISNITVNTPTADDIGLFGYLGEHATVRNLTITDAEMTGQYRVGALVGGSWDGATVTDVQVVNATISGVSGIGGLAGIAQGTFSDVEVHATVTGTEELVGGGFGHLTNASVNTSFFDVTVNGSSDDVGGIAGYVSNSNITNSYVVGTVTGSDTENTGGIFGDISSADTPSSVTTSYSSVAVDGGVGSGIHGDIRNPNITVTNSYYNKDVARATEQHTAGRTLAELRSGTPTDDIFTDWSTDIWDFGTATELPIVTALDNLPPASHSDDTDHDGLIEISTVSELQALESRIGTECPSATCHGFELDDDIDLNGVTWDPIKAQSDEFNLIFDGNDHTISNITVNTPTADDIGLFGYLGEHATVRNLTITDAEMTGQYRVGALVGGSWDGATVTDVQVVNATISGVSGIGGLAGIAQGTFSDVEVHATVTGTEELVGGGFGHLTNASVNTSFFDVTVNGSSDDVGGIAGYVSNSNITNSYVVGTVTGSDTENTGGIFGDISSADTPSSVTTSYSSVAVDGGVGSGIHGDIRNPNITVTNSYYNKDVARATEQHTAGRTLAELRSGTPTDDIFTDWSTDIWDFGTATELPELN